MGNICLILIAIFALLFNSSVARAQEASPFLPFETPVSTPTTDPNFATQVTPLPESTVAPESTPVVVSGAPQTNRLETLQKEYLLLLEQYRAQEQSHLVSKAQYAQLNTLASQELAVQDARKLIDIRASIFLIYLDMLEELLNQTKGIPLENKSPQLVKLRLLKETVLLHKNINNGALDRFALDNESLNFTKIIKNIEMESYYTLSLIRVGRVQQAFDKLLSVRTQVEENVMNRQLSSAQKAQKERGFAEIQREVDQTAGTFAPIKDETFSKMRIRDLGAFNGLTAELNPVFAGMNQTIQFLQEIRK